MKNSVKTAARFFACTAVVVYLFVGLRSLNRDGYYVAAYYAPDIVLTNGRIAVPGTVVAFVRSTAHEAATEFFADAEEDPSLDEFLTMFFCNACSRNCLLLTPRCVAGRLRNNQATDVHMEMFPHMVGLM